MVKVLGGSLDRTEVRAQNFTMFNVELRPFSFDKLSLFSSEPWQKSETQLEIVMSMTNKIDLGQLYQVVVELPEDFRIASDKLDCSNLFHD